MKHQHLPPVDHGSVGWVLVMLAAALGCQSTSGEKAPAVTPTYTARVHPTVLAAHDGLLADLDSLRSLLRLEDQALVCNSYSKVVSSQIKGLAAAMAGVKRERTTVEPAALDHWQATHAAALSRVIEEVVEPIRRSISCARAEADDGFHRSAAAVVALAEPRQLPRAIQMRESMFIELFDRLGGSTVAPEQCAKQLEFWRQKVNQLRAEHEKLSPVLRFVDDMLWEEEFKKEHETRIRTLEKACPELI